MNVKNLKINIDIDNTGSEDELSYLREVKGITNRDRLRNDKLRKELKVEYVLDKIEKQQLQWFGHVMERVEERQAKSGLRVSRRQQEVDKRKPGIVYLQKPYRNAINHGNKKKNQQKTGRIWQSLDIVHSIAGLVCTLIILWIMRFGYDIFAAYFLLIFGFTFRIFSLFFCLSL